MENWGAFVLQKARKDGHLRVPRLRIHYRTTHVKTTLISTEELQPWDSQMTIFSCLLQHKGAPIFQIKQPLFWKKRQISASLEGAEQPVLSLSPPSLSNLGRSSKEFLAWIVQKLGKLVDFVPHLRCRIVRFLLKLFQKSGCLEVFRLQFLCCRALSSEDLFHIRELQDLPPKLREKSRWKVGFRVNFPESFYSESSIFLKKLPNSTSILTSKTPDFLKKWMKILGGRRRKSGRSSLEIG